MEKVWQECWKSASHIVAGSTRFTEGVQMFEQTSFCTADLNSIIWGYV